MKKVISVSTLLIIMFLVFEFTTTYFKNGHEISYQIISDDNTFDVVENYNKEYNNTYDLVIKNNKETYYYTLSNNFNKQKQIVKEIYYYQNNDESCIYPILKNGDGSYLECLKDDKLYSKYAYHDSDFINKIENDLLEKGYIINKINNEELESFNSTIIYQNNLIKEDTITLWDYKGIQIIKDDNHVAKHVLGFDKYENNQGYLVDNYYVIPAYTNGKVLEFNKVNIININTLDEDTIDLKYTLSSNTYINGVIDNKLYYTDPSNLLQIEVNPKKKNSRLIGSKDIGGQNYQGDWESTNIYDFVSNQIKYSEIIPDEVKNNYSYTEIIESGSSYYYYNPAGDIYQIPKSHLDVSIKLVQANNLNNFNISDETIYYVVDDSLYYINLEKGNNIVLKNKELKFNKNNRVSVMSSNKK